MNKPKIIFLKLNLTFKCNNIFGFFVSKNIDNIFIANTFIFYIKLFLINTSISSRLILIPLIFVNLSILPTMIKSLSSLK